MRGAVFLDQKFCLCGFSLPCIIFNSQLLHHSRPLSDHVYKLLWLDYGVSLLGLFLFLSLLIQGYISAPMISYLSFSTMRFAEIPLLAEFMNRLHY